MTRTHSPNVPADSTPAGRCTHNRGRGGYDGERRYTLDGQTAIHSRDGSECDQPVAPEWIGYTNP